MLTLSLAIKAQNYQITFKISHFFWQKHVFFNSTQGPTWGGTQGGTGKQPKSGYTWVPTINLSLVVYSAHSTASMP